ncbi:hypothetical protein ADICYQ_4768 [Cyclobacterium qasimii M12-11B]|uniref:Uncharacterized protein n=1 Tax=Cyclobacterium qasimii M12-11B TaxID=641524 RepID=S7V767_9BACT|nr:hypothetical protein ADICYQ_4768 [Cyclobacterium qasimii M12-11B]
MRHVKISKLPDFLVIAIPTTMTNAYRAFKHRLGRNKKLK